jgi:anaerobic carbon-monoxide dehydrogenase iron sulfur subunit
VSYTAERKGVAKESPSPQPRVRVEGNLHAAFPLQCRHCSQAPCLDACLTGALVRDEQSGLVILRENLCIGCWTCTAFCPYGVIAPSPERGVAIKCDRCLYMEIPACVDVCPTKALEVVELAEMDALLCGKRRKTARAAAASAGDGIRLLDVRI